MNMRVLIHYHHGLGDCVMLTPQLRHFSEEIGAQIDLMCVPSVVKSKLLQQCPYVDNLIEIPNPWHGNSYARKLRNSKQRFDQRSKKYDEAYFIDHAYIPKKWHKIDVNSAKCHLFTTPPDSQEVFIPDEIRNEADEFIEEMYPDGYIFKHTDIEFHPEHNWEAIKWIDKNLDDLPIFDTGAGRTHYKYHDNINFSFRMLQRASHVVLSSSVMVHAADAMGKQIDVLYKGTRSSYDMPINSGLVKEFKTEKGFPGKNDRYRHWDRPDYISLRDRYTLACKENISRIKLNMHSLKHKITNFRPSEE